MAQPETGPAELTIENFDRVRRLRESLGFAEEFAIDARNAQVVNIGTQRYADGWTTEDLVAAVWGTVKRHKELLFEAGVATYGRPKNSSYPSVGVKSNAVEIAEGVNAVLRLDTIPARSRGFYEEAKRKGYKYHSVINRYIDPRMCLVSTFDAGGSHIASNRLDPDEFRSPDVAFRTKWGDVAFPFTGYREFDSVIDRESTTPRSPDYTLESRRMSDQRLIYAAGLQAVHDSWLDLVERKL